MRSSSKQTFLKYSPYNKITVGTKCSVLKNLNQRDVHQYFLVPEAEEAFFESTSKNITFVPYALSSTKTPLLIMIKNLPHFHYFFLLDRLAQITNHSCSTSCNSLDFLVH